MAKPSMPYEAQEEFCYNVLRVAPVKIPASVMADFFLLLGYTLTMSNFTKAQQRVKGLPTTPPKMPKEKYIVALATLYPALAATLIQRKGQQWYGEDTRLDRVLHWVEHARAFPMDKTEAKFLIAEAESGRNRLNQPTFDLGA